MWLSAVAFAAPEPVGPVSIQVDVTGPLAEVTVRRAYIHRGSAPVDAELWFALPPAAVVDRLSLTVGARRVESRVVARQEAHAVYARAAAAGQLATVLDAHDADTVRQRISNLLPDERVDIELHLVQTVDRHDGIWDLVLPLTVAPRLQDPAGQGPTFRLDTTQERVDLSVTVHDDLAWIESPSHAFRSARGAGEAQLGIEGARPDREVTIRWASADQDPHAALWVGPGSAGQGFGLLQWEAPAPWARAAPAPFDLVLVVDASDSQVGRWPQVLAAVDTLLAGLREEDRVTVLVFADGVAGLAVRERATTELRRDLAARLGSVPLGGGTGLARALRFAASLPVPPPRNKTVVVLSDGGSDETLPALPGATVHAVGVGRAVARATLHALANGLVVTVHPEDDPVKAVAPVVEALAGPVATELAVVWAGQDSVPSLIPPVYADRSVTVLARDVPCAAVQLTGRYLGVPFVQEVIPVCVSEGRPLEASWARERVAALAAAGQAAAATEVALAQRIVSPYTSLVGVDSAIRDPADVSVAASVPLWFGSDAGTEAYVLDASQRIPAGRTYQSAVQTMPYLLEVGSVRPSVALAAIGVFQPPVAFRWRARERDVSDWVGLAAVDPGVTQVSAVDESSRVVLGAPKVGTNNLEAFAAVYGAFGADATLGGVDAELSGPVVRDRGWAALGLRTERVWFAGVESLRAAGWAGTTWQPHTDHRLNGRVFRDAHTIAFDGREEPAGGGGFAVSHEAFPSPTASARWEVAGDRQELGAARRDRLDANASAKWTVDRHELRATAHLARLGWTEAAGWIGGGGMSDSWTPHRRVRVDGSVRVDHAGQWWASPSLVVGLTEVGKWRVAGGVFRFVDTDRYVPAPPAVPTAWEATALLQGSPLSDLSLSWWGTVRVGRLPFRGAPALLAAPDLPVIEVARTVASSHVQVRREFSRRWMGIVGWRWNAAPAPDPVLASSADAPWVAGYLDPYRRHALSGTARWELPTDPWTITVAGYVRTASPVQVGEGWWLGRATVAGLSASQDIHVRRGTIQVGGSYTWSENELGAGFLPPEAWALVGDQVGPAVEPRGRVAAQVSYTY